MIVEPFAGGGSVSLAAVSEGLVERAVLIERDEDVGAVWRVMLSDAAPELAERIRSFALDPGAVDAVLRTPPRDELERAFRTLLHNRVARGGIITAGAGLLRRGERDRGLNSRWYSETLAERVLDIAALRERITFELGDGVTALGRHADDSAGYFIDPPYTVGGFGPGARLYRHAHLDHARLFAVAAHLPGEPLLTYADTENVRELADEHAFERLRLPVRTAHHRATHELLLGRNLGWARQRLAPRHGDALARRKASDPATRMALFMAASESPSSGADLVHVDEAAQVLGVSRRTVERLAADGALVRCRGDDGRSYITARSLDSVRRQRHEPLRRGSSSQDLAGVLASMERLLDTLRDDRAALLAVTREREEARERVARLEAELEAERAHRHRLERELPARRELGAARRPAA